VQPRPTSDGPASPTERALGALRPLRLDQVRFGAGLLGTWQRRNASATLPHCIRQLDDRALSNLRRTAAGERSPHTGLWFTDSDVYKTLEAAGWQLAHDPADEGLRQFVAETTELLSRAQDSDGYLNSYFQVGPGEQRWGDLVWSHELYCAGHLIQAAVAAARVGVAPELLEVARRFADLVVRQFGPDGTDGICGHPEIETALVELYRVTGHRPYLEMAQRFIDLRGKGMLPEGQFGSPYHQDHVPVRDATEVTGHAVRQLYLLAGVVDVAVETGDTALLASAERLWDSAFKTKTYVTGAHGSRHRDEAFGDPYELPPDRAYGETCAAIASFHWNWRMLLATGRHRYADEMERVLYNAIAGATGDDGVHFFYSNPLHLRSGHDGAHEDSPSQRLPWYTCPCCPPNLARLMASLQAYVATTDDDGLQVHLYASGTIDGPNGVVEVETNYPWDGRVEFTVQGVGSAPWTLALRVPAWCDAATLEINGEVADLEPVNGYLRVTRDWASATRIVLDLAMPPRPVVANPRVDAVRGCVALHRGPLVYAIEQADLPEQVELEDIRLDLGAPIEIGPPREGISVVLSAAGTVSPPPEALYGQAPAAHSGTGRVLTLTAIPYFQWGNRVPGPMRVWIPVDNG
jgi:DUF1680 family protein